VGGPSSVAAWSWWGCIDPTYWCPWGLEQWRLLSESSSSQSRLLMGILSTSRSRWLCRVMVWPLEALILEEINPISKSKRHAPHANTGRRTIRGPGRCITQGDWSQASNSIFQKSKDCRQIWEVSLAVRRSTFLLFRKATSIRGFIWFWSVAMAFNNFFGY
jgi:hypothetical protein